MTARLPRVRIDVQLSAVEWFRQNGYEDALVIIEKLRARWKRNGKGSRKDWWLICAGTVEGAPRKVEGLRFPVIAACRRRQGYPVVYGARENSPHELAPPIRRQKRWKGKFKRATK